MPTLAKRTRGIKHISTYIDVFDAVFQSSDIAKRMKSLNVCLLFHSDCQHESKAHQVIWMPCLKIMKTAVLLYMNLYWNYSNLQMINPINWPCLRFFFLAFLILPQEMLKFYIEWFLLTQYTAAFLQMNK